MKKEDVIKKLIEPHKAIKTVSDSMSHRMSTKKPGYVHQAITHGRGSKFIISNYGCQRCPLKMHCEDYPHTNGICMKRSQMYADYIKAGRGDTVPLMRDQLALMNTEADIEYQKCLEKSGQLTEEWFRLHELALKIADRIKSAESKVKMKVEYNIWDEMRDAVKTGVKKITIETDNVELKDES